MIFLIDRQGIWFKNYFEDIKSRKSSRILIKNCKMFSVSIKIHPCYPNKEKMCKLFVYNCNIFPVIDPNNILILYINCYIILITYLLDSALEPSYNLSKNLLLLPWILKLIVYMVNDSTPVKINILN